MPRSFGEISPAFIVTYSSFSNEEDDDENDMPLEMGQHTFSDDNHSISSESQMDSELENGQEDDIEYDLHDVNFLFHQLSNKLQHLGQPWVSYSSSSASSSLNCSTPSLSPSFPRSSPMSSSPASSIAASHSNASSPSQRRPRFSSFFVDEETLDETLHHPIHRRSSLSYTEETERFHPTHSSLGPPPPSFLPPLSSSYSSPTSIQLESYIDQIFFPDDLPLSPPTPTTSSNNTLRLPCIPTTLLSSQETRSAPPLSSSSRPIPILHSTTASHPHSQIHSPPETSSSSMTLSESSAVSSSSLPSFNDILRCFICFGTLEKAVLCPHCSKMGCHACLKKWLTEQRSVCPYCRTSLDPSQLIPCRFLEDLQHHVKGYVSSQVNRDPCQEHQKTLYYVCESCEEPICSDCAMFDEKHTGHTFKHLEKVYSSHVSKINEERLKLLARLPLFEEASCKIEKELATLQETKKRLQLEMEAVMEDAQQDLDDQMKARFKSIEDYKSSIELQLNQIGQVYNFVQDAVFNYPQSRFVKHAPMMLKKLQGCNLALPTSTFPPLTLKLSSQPTFETSPPMIITNGTSYVQGKSIVSDVFWVSGVPWRLKVYPMGNQKSKAHTSLFLEKLTPEEVHYVIQFRSVQHPSIIKEFQTKFTAKKAFGLSHFYPHALMDTQASGIQLSFQFSVRPLTYLQKSLDLENYIAWLKQPSSFPEMDAELEEMDIAFNHQDALTTFS